MADNLEKNDAPELGAEMTDEAKKTEIEQSVPNADTPTAKPKRAEKRKKQKFSGAYYYVEGDAQEIIKNGFIRTLFTILAFLMQCVVLLFPQAGLEHVTNNYPSYAFTYMFLVFVFLGTSIYVIIMNFTRYKFVKRIPKERAPKSGFKRFVFFGTELYMVYNAVIFAIEISFVCFAYDGWGLAGVFVSALAAGCAVGARIYTHNTLKNSTLIPAKTDN